MEDKKTDVVQAGTTEVEIDATAERAKAIAAIVITAIANVANVIGYAVDAEPFVTAATSVISAASIVWAWWRNNNVTVAAMVGSAVITDIKRDGKVS